MTIAKAMQLGMMAKQRGWAVAVEAGLFQLQNVTYDKKGNSIIEPQSGWVSYDEAVKLCGC